MRSDHPSPCHKLKGSALIVILIILGLAAALLVSALKSNPQVERDKITADALAKAKDALIGYAATYRDTHPTASVYDQVFGYLPCPDFGRNAEGLEDNSCIGATNKDKNVVGRLPWRTLGLPPLRDGNGDCLWYAVSGGFKSKAQTDLMNWDTNGQFEIYAPDGASKIAGTSPANRAVAIIFSPGRPLGNQNRAPDANITAPECGGNMDVANYLDTTSVNGKNFTNYLANTVNAAAHVVDATAYQIKQFIAGDAKDTSGNTVVNDRLLFITPADIFANKVEKRSDYQPLLVDTTTGMLKRTAECIANYGLTIQSATKRLPWAAPLNMDALSATKYGTDSNYAATTNTLAGRTPYNADATHTKWLDVANTPYCPNFDASTFHWWQNHKDQIFYAVANAYKPGPGVADCSTSTNCLTVNGNGPYAAVVIFSGKKLTGQNRNTNSDYTSPDKATLSNYLEGNNLTAMATTGNGNFTKGAISSSTNNDTLVCLKCDLSLDVNCNTTGLPTCSASAGCPAGQSISWPLGSPNCSAATTSAGSNGSTVVLSSTAPNTTGSATAICNLNTWQLSSSPASTCSLLSTGGGGVYTGIVPPTVSQNPGWTGNTGLNSVTLSDGTIITVTSTSGSTPTIYVSNTGIGVASGSGPKSLDLGNGEQMSFTFTGGQQSLAILVGMLKNNDLGYITFKNNGTTVGTATFQGCTSSNTSMYSNIAPAGNPTFNQVILTSGTSNGYYINQVAACATGTCAITGSGATGATLCSSWVSP